MIFQCLKSFVKKHSSGADYIPMPENKFQSH